MSLLHVPGIGDIRKDKTYSIIPKIFGLPLISKRIVQTFHKRGAQVIGYLPENNAAIKLCLDAGVDYILSNDKPANK